MNEKKFDINKEIDSFLNIFLVSDNITSPDHYQGKSGCQAIDVIENFELNYNLGNVIKYVLRCRKKGELLNDLKKACYYLRREIKSIEGGLNG